MAVFLPCLCFFIFLFPICIWCFSGCFCSVYISLYTRYIKSARTKKITTTTAKKNVLCKLAQWNTKDLCSCAAAVAFVCFLFTSQFSFFFFKFYFINFVAVLRSVRYSDLILHFMYNGTGCERHITGVRSNLSVHNKHENKSFNKIKLIPGYIYIQNLHSRWFLPL